MNQLLLFKTLLLAVFLLVNQSIIHAQSSIGLELGTMVTSFYSSEPLYKDRRFPSIASIQPAIGGRIGLSFEHSFKDFFAIKTGVFYALKGPYLDPDIRWSLGYVTVPVLAVFTPVEPLKIGVGIDFGALVTNSFAIVPAHRVTLGLRSEIIWQMSPVFRLLLHGSLDLTPTTSVNYTDDQGAVIGTNIYKHFTGGISIAYTLKRFDKKHS
ncbi:MAG: hypothetical protein ACRBFS_21785 [Aureispira sp.]